MITPVTVACRQLLKYIHIPELQVIMLIDMVIKSQEEPVLIKIIIDDLFAEIDMHFIIHHKRQSIGLKSFFT